MWRGRTTKGANRLKWRITTNGKLGAPHTLGEFGDNPQLATDASGKTVAVWLADPRASARAFGPPRAAGRVPGADQRDQRARRDLRLVSSDRGASVAAWLTAPNGIDPEEPGRAP